jgi:alanine racemase
MNRLGLRYDNLEYTVPELVASRNLEITAVCTHFATADDPDSTLFQTQRERFEQALARLPELGVDARIRHAANSAATLRDSRVWFDFVRPGLLMFGVVPPPLACTIPLRPVMSLRSRVVAVKGVRVGEVVGYGARWTVPKAGRIAVVPAGYADGLDRRMSGTCSVLIRGKRAPIVGAVNMDMITIDVSDVKVETGDEVVVIGAQEGDRIEVREIAAAIGTNPYEVLCRVGTRIRCAGHDTALGIEPECKDAASRQAIIRGLPSNSLVEGREYAVALGAGEYHARIVLYERSQYRGTPPR